MPTYASDSTIAHGSAGSGGFNGGVAGVASGNGSAASGVAAATLQL
jgi:hypothetical protein